MAAARASATGALPGGRVLSRRRPATPCSMNRACQRQTVVFDVPVAAMTAFVPTPSALSSTIRARQTCFCGVFRSETRASSRWRSASPRVMNIPVRMPQRRTRGTQWESQPDLSVPVNPLGVSIIICQIERCQKLFTYTDETGHSGRNIFDKNDVFRLGSILSVKDIRPACEAVIGPFVEEKGVARLHANQWQEHELAGLGHSVLDSIDSKNHWVFNIMQIS